MGRKRERKNQGPEIIPIDARHEQERGRRASSGVALDRADPALRVHYADAREKRRGQKWNFLHEADPPLQYEKVEEDEGRGQDHGHRLAQQGHDEGEKGNDQVRRLRGALPGMKEIKDQGKEYEKPREQVFSFRDPDDRFGVRGMDRVNGGGPQGGRERDARQQKDGQRQERVGRVEDDLRQVVSERVVFPERVVGGIRGQRRGKVGIEMDVREYGEEIFQGQVAEIGISENVGLIVGVDQDPEKHGMPVYKENQQGQAGPRQR